MRILDGWHYYWRKTLLWAPELQVAAVTAESERRTEMIRAQAERAAARSQMSEAEFLQNQGLRVEVEALAAGGPAYARAFELINKTNQFNTTGERWSAEEFARLVASGGTAYVFRAADRFTPYGVIGVALTEGRRIRQVVMSCRVVGRGVEIAALAAILARMEGEGPATAATRDTDANLLSRDLFARLGFTQDAPGLWSLAGEAAPPPAHVSCRFVMDAVEAETA
jgi:FkbH-like protein